MRNSYLINQPNQSGHQQNLSKELKSLYSDLEESNTNDFSPGWIQTIHEIGGAGLLGTKLKVKVEDLILENQLTPSVALEEIDKIKERIDTFYDGLDKVNKGFEALGIKREDLELGECEIGVLIPRVFVENKLISLGKEIGEINFILRILCEATTGKVDDFEVRTISSSDFTLYLIATILFADKFVAILERIINNYKTILEIKKLRSELKNQGLPDKNLKGIADYANNSMKQEIKEIITEMFNEDSPVKDNGRKNELKNGAEVALNKLANRIDQGFNFDVRVPELPEPEEDEEGNQIKDEEYKSMEELVNSIFESSETLQFKKVEGEPILNLPEAKRMKKE